MDQKNKLSRRSLLGRAAWIASATLVGAVIPIEAAFAQQKVSKEAMKYQDKPNGDKQCSNCMQFEPPSSCKVVEGTISPNGYCLAWVKKA
ncbi:MAG TPA: high potential iron sulfur protein [Casimicrobiaceae bacterium]|nr:high potential iron sulfur protein [Casimicrobiaceae bacterium]